MQTGDRRRGRAAGARVAIQYMNLYFIAVRGPGRPHAAPHTDQDTNFIPSPHVHTCAREPLVHMVRRLRATHQRNTNEITPTDATHRPLHTPSHSHTRVTYHTQTREKVRTHAHARPRFTRRGRFGPRSCRLTLGDAHPKEPSLQGRLYSMSLKKSVPPMALRSWSRLASCAPLE